MLELESLSGGEQVSIALSLRLGMAHLLGASNLNFMILDEPTTHLDIDGRAGLEKLLKDYEGTICVVSHDITFIRNLNAHIIHVNNNEIDRYYGCLLYTSPSPRDRQKSRMPSSA